MSIWGDRGNTGSKMWKIQSASVAKEPDSSGCDVKHQCSEGSRADDCRRRVLYKTCPS